MTDLFGPIVSADAVEQAVVAALARWMPSYLAKLEQAEGYERGAVALPRGYVTSSEFEKWDGDQLPVYLVLNAGLAPGKPVRRGNSSYEATWAIGVAPVVSDRDQGLTRKLASTHAAAARMALLQHKSLKSPLHPEGFAISVRWEGESYADLPFLATRSLGSMRTIFGVTVKDVVTEYAGPRVPLPNPKGEDLPPGYPQIGEVDVGVHLDPLIGAPQ